MSDDRHDEVRVVLDKKIEAPVAVHARLPEIGGLVVFLGAQRRMGEVLSQQPDCFWKALWIAGGAAR